MSSKISIGIAEDHDIVRQGIIALLSGYKDIRVVFQAKDGFQLLQYLEKFPVDIVLLDIKMPKIDGEQAIPKIRQFFPKTKIIVLSAFIEDNKVVRYSDLGAHSFLGKSSGLKEMVKAIYEVSENGYYYEDRILELINEKGSSPHGIKKLTAKEKLVLSYLCEHRTPTQIADILKVKESTIAVYKHRIMQKADIFDEEQLFDFVRKHKIIKKI